MKAVSFYISHMLARQSDPTDNRAVLLRRNACSLLFEASSHFELLGSIMWPSWLKVAAWRDRHEPSLADDQRWR